MVKYKEKVINHNPFSTGKKSKLKIVFMMSNFDYHVNPDMVYDTFRILTEIPGVDLVVKPHTRSNKVWQFKEAVEKFNLQLAINTPSNSLIKWADAVIVYGSSIAIQVLYDKKVLIYPRYIDSNHFILDDMNSCWGIDNLNQFRDAIEKLIKNPSYRPYSADDVTKAIRKLVYADKDDRNVIDNHVQFIKAKVKKFY